ncbi:unnamed protein product [Effrenium voratum]|nr:unnamed protein product [Effrenium voratum]
MARPQGPSTELSVLQRKVEELVRLSWPPTTGQRQMGAYVKSYATAMQARRATMLCVATVLCMQGDDAEPLEGPMVLLPEDVSLTWKLLGAAESLGRLFSDEVGLNNEDLKVPAKVRRPEDMFELKQRDQLKKAVASVRAPVTELVEKAVEQNLDGDLLAGLPKDLWRRFARLREALVTATKEADSFVVCPQNAGREEMTGPMPTAEPAPG